MSIDFKALPRITEKDKTEDIFDGATEYTADILEELCKRYFDFIGGKDHNDWDDAYISGILAVWLIREDIFMGAESKLYLVCSDSFHYACADSEHFELEDIPYIWKNYVTWGYLGILKWIAIKRGYLPLNYVCESFKEKGLWDKSLEVLTNEGK